MGSASVKQFWFFLFFTANIVVFSILFYFFPETYDNVSREDRLIENLTALLLLLAGVFLIYTALKQVGGKQLRKFVLIAAGVLFIAGAGEEISWGQRIFDIETPDRLLEINDQDELNIHNINKKFFDRAVDRVTILFVLVMTFMHLFGKSRILYLPIPNAFIILAFAITPFYHQYNQVQLDFYHLLYLPIILWGVLGVYKRDYRILFAAILTLVLTTALGWLHATHNELFPAHNNSANEYREYLFALCCSWYAVSIMVERGAERT